MTAIQKRDAALICFLFFLVMVLLTLNVYFLVFAEDSFSPPLYGYTTVNVTVLDVNDDSPQFTLLDDSSAILIRLSISEQAPGLMFVYKLSAWDKDQGDNAKISYSIAGK